MATLTSLFTLASNAIDANQTALNVTANNVANQNTPGYTREVVNWQTLDSVSVGNVTYGQGVSTGVGATSVRDRVLEQRLQQQTQTAAQSSSLVATLGQVQNVFGLSATSTSAATTTLGTAIDGLYNSFSTLEANASDPATRSTVLTQASSLAEALNAASSQLTQTTTSLNVQVGSTVGQINTLLTTVADLNQKIATLGPTNGDAGALEDQRQLQIANLSQLIGLDQITTENNGITLTTTGGELLVSGAQTYKIGTAQSGATTHLTGGSSGNDITASVSGGSLGGLLQARDVVLPGYSNSLDQLAFGVGTAVNQQNALGLDLNGNPGGQIFSLPTTATGTAAQITVGPTVTTSSIAAAALGEGATGSTNAANLAALATGNNVSGQSASAYFASFLSQIGSATASATSDNTVQQAALTQLTSQRDSISAVSLNEEAANLTQYQRSYEAASKVFTIIDTLFADVLNLGVQSAVS